jgi:integrase
MNIYQTKNGIYTYRKRVEVGLEDAYREETGNSQPFFKRSLKTRDSKAAANVAVAVEMEYKLLMERLRHRSHLSPDTLRKAHLSLRVGGILRSSKVKLELDVIQELKKQIEQELELHRLKLKSAGDLREIVKTRYGLQRKKAMPLDDYCQHLQNAVRVLGVYERMFTEQDFDLSSEMAKTQRYMTMSRLGFVDTMMEELQAYRQQTPQQIADQVVPAGTSPKLSEAVERWKEKNHPSESSYREWSYTVKRFIELHGDLRVAAITDEHVVTFRDAMLKIPARLPNRYMAMPLDKLVACAAKGEFSSMKPRSSNTVRKMVVGISTILQVMVDDGYITRNTAQKKAPKSTDDGSSRPPFEFDELHQIFSSGHYQSHFWNSNVQDKPSRYWAPLIALFTGCRAGEIAQLLLTDIRKEDGVDYISINNDSDKRIKTKSAARDIPIHEMLLKMGFMTYVEQLRKKGETQLFPDLNLGRQKVSGAISKDFSRYCEALGLKKDGKSFHSFRDNFSDACVNAGLDDRTTDRLLGHAMQGAKKHYGKGLWLETASNFINRLYLEKLSLYHLSS